MWEKLFSVSVSSATSANGQAGKLGEIGSYALYSDIEMAVAAHASTLGSKVL